jgi:tetratricopeptide (TPR) repeat protein
MLPTAVSPQKPPIRLHPRLFPLPQSAKSLISISTRSQIFFMNAARIRKLRRKIRFRRAIRRWRYPLILLALLFLAGAGFAGHWAYGKILNRQAWALCSRAMEDMREGKIQEARMGAETALRIQPGYTAATRLLGRIQAMTGQPEAALATFQKLTDERQLSLDDIKLYARLASQKGETQLAGRLAEAAGKNGDPAFPHLLKADTLLREKKPALAEAELRAAIKVDQTDTSKIAFLDFLLAKQRPGQSNIEAATMIQDFSERDDALGANALALGLRTGLMNPDKRGEWVEKLRAHPKANTGHRFLADSAAVALNPDAKSEIATALAKDFQSRPLADRAAAAKWLVVRREHTQALSILPLDEAITDRGAFVVWLDAQALAGDWSGSLAALDRKDNPLLSHTSQLFRGLALKKLGKTAEADASLQAAIAESADDPEKFAFTTTYLLGIDENQLFESNLARVATRTDLAPSLWRGVYPAVNARRDAAFSLRVLEALSASRELAALPEFQNELAYLQILLGQPAAIDALGKRVDENPDDLANLSVMAFHNLKTGNAGTAMALFDGYGPDVDARTLPPRILTIYCATLAANGKKDLALKIASLIPREAPTRQEADLLKHYFQPGQKPR